MREGERQHEQQQQREQQHHRRHLPQNRPLVGEEYHGLHVVRSTVHEYGFLPTMYWCTTSGWLAHCPFFMKIEPRAKTSACVSLVNFPKIAAFWSSASQVGALVTAASTSPASTKLSELYEPPVSGGKSNCSREHQHEQQHGQ